MAVSSAPQSLTALPAAEAGAGWKLAWPSLAVATIYSYPLWEQAREGLTSWASHYRSGGPSLIYAIAALIHTLLIAAALYVVATLAVRWKPGIARYLDGMFVLLGVALLWIFSHRTLPVYRHPRAAFLFYSGVGVASLVFLFATKYGRLLVSAVYTVGCLLAMLPAILTADILRLFVQSDKGRVESFYKDPSYRKAAGKRLVWVVLDEFDPGIAFRSRPGGLKLPILDRLLKTSVSGSHVEPAGRWTQEVIPAFLAGQRVKKVQPEGPSDLRVWFENGGESTMSKSQTIFTRLKARGVHAAATNWYNPICRWQTNSSLDECVWVPSIDSVNSLRRERIGKKLGIGWALRNTFAVAASFGGGEFLDEYSEVRRQQLEAFQQLHQSGLREVADPSFGFVFLHYNIPHPLGIFDAKRGVFDISGAGTYLDNLVLADNVLSDLMKAAPTTAFLITSDHSFRPEVWNFRPTWMLEAPEVRAHPKDTHVLFLFHDPADNRPQVVEEALNAVSGHDLALAWLDGSLPDHDAVASWLRQDRSGDR